MKPFYTPSEETLQVLNSRRWICSYSGGKDSTTLVTWIEWLRRSGQVKYDEPRLVQSDTGVEFPFLQGISRRMMELLSSFGWKCDVVRPLVREKLYCQIFGRGVTPIHPAIRRMRWCTRATKIDPMERFSETVGEGHIHLSGVRWGESQQRDGRLSLGGCSAGGECGLPGPGDRTYGPIITWKTCQVIDWLQGMVVREVRDSIKDLLEVARDLVEVYEVRRVEKPAGFFPLPMVEKVQALRFGCIGCPAITTDKITDTKIKNHPQWKALRKIYLLWEKCRRSTNRLRAKKEDKSNGPIKMAKRKELFEELLRIQEESGVTLVTEEDIRFIHECWEKKVYPRGWSEEDELR